jgi:hypothetical protein
VCAAARRYAKGNQADQEMKRAAHGKPTTGQNFEGLGVHDLHGFTDGLAGSLVRCLFQFTLNDRSFGLTYPCSFQGTPLVHPATATRRETGPWAYSISMLSFFW